VTADKPITESALGLESPSEEVAGAGFEPATFRL
jgi:hypothetical protein